MPTIRHLHDANALPSQPEQPFLTVVAMYRFCAADGARSVGPVLVNHRFARCDYAVDEYTYAAIWTAEVTHLQLCYLLTWVSAHAFEVRVVFILRGSLT